MAVHHHHRRRYYRSDHDIHLLLDYLWDPLLDCHDDYYMNDDLDV
jgi:hypothetical protein